MRLSDFLSPESIVSALKARDKRGVLEEMVDKIVENLGGGNSEKLLEALLQREHLGSTGIGYGVAIPHSRVKGLEHIALLFGRSLEGIDFQSMDGKPAFLFFLILAPEKSTVVHIKLLARLSQLLKDAGFRDRLMRAGTGEELYRIIVGYDRKI